MTKRDLIMKLEKYPLNTIIVLSDADGGWCNIDKIEFDGSVVRLIEEENPLFHDN